MTKLDYLKKAVFEIHGSIYKFSKYHDYNPGSVSLVLSADRPISNHLARLIASDLADTEEERTKIFSELIQ